MNTTTRTLSMRKGSLPLMPIVVTFFAIAAFLGVMYYALPATTGVSTTNTALRDTNPVYCTADAKLCPDGSAVGRTGPNCEFAVCPSSNTNSNLNANSNPDTNINTTQGSKTYTDKKFGFSFTYPSEMDFGSPVGNSAQFLYGSFFPGGQDSPTMSGSYSLEVSTYDHRLGQLARLGDSDAIPAPHALTLPSGTATWGVLEAGENQVRTQLQFIGHEQDVVMTLTEWGAATSTRAEGIFSSFTIPDRPSTTASYRLDCVAEPYTNKNLPSQTWWSKFYKQIITGWTLDEACLNADLQQVVYEKSKLDFTGQAQGQSQIGVYTIATDRFVKATPRRAIYGGECAGHFSWDIQSSVINYRCSAGDAGAYWYGEYSFNPVTEVNTKIRECSGDAETNKETCS